MNRHAYDTNLERFVLGMATLLLLAWLAVANSFNEKCPGGRQLLEVPCHTNADNYPPH
ncbi:MAG: hypothetical protein JOZ96_07765 [Acidobacteria bacterium]|nr:hypothetical protein [Acidobacteriota bacterium]